jgi:hypothetical protein
LLLGVDGRTTQQDQKRDSDELCEPNVPEHKMPLHFSFGAYAAACVRRFIALVDWKIPLCHRIDKSWKVWSTKVESTMELQEGPEISTNAFAFRYIAQAQERARANPG